MPGALKAVGKDANYLKDLNAMHEARKALTYKQAVTYRMNLMLLSDGRKAAFLTVEAALCDATAAQRAEAFLRAIGKWVEPAELEAGR